MMTSPQVSRPLEPEGYIIPDEEKDLCYYASIDDSTNVNRLIAEGKKVDDKDQEGRRYLVFRGEARRGEGRLIDCLSQCITLGC